MKIIIFVLGLLVSLLAGYGILSSYNAAVDPKNIYGNWVELHVLESRQIVISFNEQGVYRNSHLISTTFTYNGRIVEFSTGDGDTTYRITGTQNTPQLKRIQPETPPQILVREEDEHLFDVQEDKQVLRSKPSFF